MSLLSRLFHLRPTENRISEEDFFTEVLGFLLQHSLLENTNLFQSFCKLISINVLSQDISESIIKAQEEFSTTNSKRAIPDLTIKFPHLFVFIEVKISAELNQYAIDEADKNKNEEKETYNQIEKYHRIILPGGYTKKIVLLTLYPKHFKNKTQDLIHKHILWQEIYRMLRNYCSINPVEKFLKNQFLKLMEENNMVIKKVNYDLISGIESLKNLIFQIEDALNHNKISHSKSFGYYYLGFNIHPPGQTKGADYGWVGTPWKGEKIDFQIIDKNAVEKIKLKKDHNFEEFNNSSFIKSFHFELEKYFCCKAEEQCGLIRKWVKKRYLELIELAK